MANGLLGKGVTAVNTPLNPYTVPTALNFATASILLVNTGTSDATVTTSLTTNEGTPAVGDHIAYKIVIPANGGIYEIGCQIMSPGERVVIQSDKAGVVARVSGLEQAVVSND